MLELRAVNNLQRRCQIQTSHQNTAGPRDQAQNSKRKAKGQPKTYPKRGAERKKQRRSKNSATAPNQPNV